MARVPSPWFRAGRGWFVQVAGRQHALGVVDENALETAQIALKSLLSRLSAVSTARPTSTVAEAVGAFLARQAGRVSAECLRQYRITLDVHLVRTLGARDVSSLTADELEEWARNPRWSSSTRHGRLGAVATFLKWAGHPLKLARPPKESRGADAVLTDEQFERVLSAYDPKYGGDLRELLRVLRLTGARPGEVISLAVDAIDWPNACARLRKHKGAARGRARVLYFNSAALAILGRQRDRYGSGLLFRTRAGGAYRPKGLVQQMQRMSKRAGVRAIAYGERHGFATRALCAGVPDAVVAELLGHTSTAMVARNYGHLSAQSRVLREAAEKVAG
jgi:integrase